MSQVTMTPPLAVEYLQITAIKPDPGNARTHSAKQVAQIGESITAFGFTNPILIDEDGVIIAGHGRLLAAKKLGLKSAPTITLEHLSPVDKRALRLADNKIASHAGWNTDLLAQELKAIIIEVDFNVELTGFSTGEIDVLLAPIEFQDPEDEELPIAPPQRAQLGDIWRLGLHRIGCGDCRDKAFLRSVVGEGEKVDVAFLDPPYNVSIANHANVKSNHREFAMASGEMTPQAFTGFLTDCLGACAEVSRDGAVHYICMDWRHLGELKEAGDAIYGALLNLCVWNKSNAGMGSLYRSKHELVFVYRVGQAQHFNAVQLGKNGRNRTNVWDYASVNTFGGRSDDLAMHPTVKPVGMVVDAIKDTSRRGEIVLDVFLGSGTTLIAAERAGRRFRGMEIDPLYVDIAIERWAAMTGEEPVLVRRISEVVRPTEMDEVAP